MARHAGLDAARALATALVVSGHAAISFMVTPIGWAIQDDRRSLGVDLFVWLVRGFAMPTFFWLSGYFARLVYQRGGLAGFARHRWTRLLLPLAVAIVPCSLAEDALWDWGRRLAGRPAVADDVPKLAASDLPITLGHLWYLYYLLALSAAAIAIVTIARRLRVRAPRGFAIIVVTAALALGPLARAGALHLDTPLGLRVDLGVLTYFGAFFAWGWLVDADRAELERYARRAWWFAAAAAAALATVVPALWQGRAPSHAIAASGAFTIAMVGAFLGLCVRHARRTHRAVALVSDASYWVYVTHFPLVVLLQITIARVAWPGPVKYVAIVGATALACLLSYAALARARGWLAASRRRAGTRAPGRPAGTR